MTKSIYASRYSGRIGPLRRAVVMDLKAHGWGLISVGGGASMGVSTLWLGNYPLAQQIVFGSGIVATILGLGLLFWPRPKGDTDSERSNSGIISDANSGMIAGRDVNIYHTPPPVWGKTEKQTAEQQAITARIEAERKLLKERRVASERSHPDWKIREAFFHFDPSVLNDNRWEIVGLKILDLLASHQVRAWGRRHELSGGFSALAPIRQEFWQTAVLSYRFFEERQDGEVHALARLAMGNIREEYADIRFNRVELESAWARLT